ncbi:uncharacterized protein TRAVEDRAFT_43312 [Trametes versicolor FP-101664 SS1]|uniref:uncharacterized protein n=1 Tax=Trametes versicolor (strain FP-101664) TaxID=717944 RepID=UPI0004623195|nr:uncharacterized protein TRAVEDRAFT_43312 [Trametes versicolor FP-101664 SS1]EIW63006.1 hypothetical protein TRAVEDRAFT_43312 [Trametes versicolor FP-101664 SS1]
MRRYSTGEEFWDRKPNHRTIGVNDFVGRPLTKFSSTRELVLAIRGAMRGHKRVWEEAQVLHRDISLGSILINLDNHVDDDSDDIGLIHDFDYSSLEPAGVTGSAAQDVSDGRAEATRLPGRIASYFFMAVDLIDPGTSSVTHRPYHDLESFYWLILWVVLRHTRCALRARMTPGKQVCATRFKHCDSSPLGWAMKFSWALPKGDLDVAGNAPLTTLMKKFKALVFQQNLAIMEDSDEVVLTHCSVLQIFDDVLELDGWPEKDWIPCNVEEDLDPPSPGPLTVGVIPPGYPPNMSEAQRNAMILAGEAAARGHLPQDAPRVMFLTSSDSREPRNASGSGLKRPLAEADQFLDPSEAPSAPKKSKSTMESSLPAATASTESS